MWQRFPIRGYCYWHCHCCRPVYLFVFGGPFYFFMYQMTSTVCYFRANYDLLKSVIFCSKVLYNGQWHQFQVFFFGCGLWEPFSPSTKNCWKREGTWDIFWWRHSCETLPPIKKKSVVGLSSSTKRTIYFGGINRSISVSDTWLNLARTVGLK